MRQKPVGEPAATAAWNFGRPRRRSSLKRLRPFCYCRQRYARSLRRIHASRLVSIRGVWQKPKYPRHPRRYGARSSITLRQAEPPGPAGHLPDLRLELGKRFRRDAPLAPVIRDAEAQEFALLRSRYRALCLVDLQPQLIGQKPAHRCLDPFSGASAAHIDVAVIGVPAEAETPAGHFPDLRLELGESFWRDALLAPIIRDAESQEFALLRSRDRTLRLVGLQPQLIGQKPTHRGLDPFSGAATAHIDVAVIGVTAEAETPTGQLLVEIVSMRLLRRSESGRPCGVPSSTGLTKPSSITPS